MVRFLSLAAMSQAVLIASQLILLPLQVHIWGQEMAALWLAINALAAVTGAADLGLRNVGFAAIAAGETGNRLSTLWTVIRLQMAVTGAIITAIAIFHFAPQAGNDWLFVWLLTTASALDGFFLVRVGLLEASGLIAVCEVQFLLLALSRLVIGAAAITLFRADPLVLSVIWIALILGVLVLQSRLEPARRLAPILGHWRLEGAARAYREARWSAAGPLASWAQIQLPVVALQMFAPAALVSSFVAIRSVFSLVRAIIAQVARIASVQFIDRIRTHGLASARAFLLLVGGGCAWVAVGVSLGVFAENQMILGPLFKLPDDNFIHFLILTLALSSIFSVHQIFAMSLMRQGEFRRGGVASYIFFAAMALAGVLAIATQNAYLLAVGLVLCDASMLAQILWPFVFFPPGSTPSAELGRARVSFALSMTLWIALTIASWALFWWYFTHHQTTGLDMPRLAASLAIALVAVLAAAACFVGLSREQIRALSAKAPSGA